MTEELTPKKKWDKGAKIRIDPSCPHETIDNDFHCRASLCEAPESDDNIFHIGEKLFEKCEVYDKKYKEWEIVPDVDIEIINPDGDVMKEKTNIHGRIDFSCGAEGLYQIKIPSIKSTSQFRIVE